MIKRSFDLILACILMVGLSPVLGAVALWMVVRQDLPIFYVSERMRETDRPFQLVKFRTMRQPSPGESNSGVSGGDKSDRITALGHLLRRYRLDELPQLWNILRGDMSFVGPRPPLRRYTEQFPTLYNQVLRSKPGITGLATLVLHNQEQTALARCGSFEETEALYTRRFVPRKAKLDLVYQSHANLCYDVILLWATFAHVFLGGSKTSSQRVRN